MIFIPVGSHFHVVYDFRKTPIAGEGHFFLVNPHFRLSSYFVSSNKFATWLLGHLQIPVPNVNRKPTTYVFDLSNSFHDWKQLICFPLIMVFYSDCTKLNENSDDRDLVLWLKKLVFSALIPVLIALLWMGVVIRFSRVPEWSGNFSCDTLIGDVVEKNTRLKTEQFKVISGLKRFRSHHLRST